MSRLGSLEAVTPPKATKTLSESLNFNHGTSIDRSHIRLSSLGIL